MVKHVCPHCGKNLSSRSSLNNHIATAKYCLKTRGKVTAKKKFPCEYCEKVFTSKFSLQRHISICTNQVHKNYQKIISELKKQLKKKEQHIRDLEKQIENIALKAVSRPTTVQNDNRVQTINNLLPITDEHLQEQAKFLTIDHIKQGPLGYSQYITEYPLKDRIVCVDFSRRKIKYKNNNGNVVSDPEMTSLSKKLFSAIQARNERLCHKYVQELHTMLMNNMKQTADEMDEEESVTFNQENDKVHNIITDIYSQVKQVQEITEGKKPELFHEFVRDVCSRSVT